LQFAAIGQLIERRIGHPVPEEVAEPRRDRVVIQDSDVLGEVQKAGRTEHRPIAGTQRVGERIPIGERVRGDRQVGRDFFLGDRPTKGAPGESTNQRLRGRRRIVAEQPRLARVGFAYR